MPSAAERQAFNVVGPTQSNTAGEGVTILAATTSAANTAIPESFYGRYVYLVAKGDLIFVNFGAAASPDIDKTNTGGSTFAAGTSASNAIPIPDGTRLAVRLNRREHAYIKWQANASSSYLYIYPTTQGGL